MHDESTCIQTRCLARRPSCDCAFYISRYSKKLIADGGGADCRADCGGCTVGGVSMLSDSESSQVNGMPTVKETIRKW
jgi:hypothetical protein